MAWCHCFCLFWYFLVHTIIPSHSYSTFIRRNSSRFLPLYLLIAGQLSGKNLPVVPSRIRTRGLPYALRYHTVPSKLRRTLLSYLAPFWATPHPNYQTCLNINQGNQNPSLLCNINTGWTQRIHFLHFFYTSLLAGWAENMLSAVSTAAGGQISQARLEHMMRIIHSEIRQCVGIWQGTGDRNIFWSKCLRATTYQGITSEML